MMRKPWTGISLYMEAIKTWFYAKPIARNSLLIVAGFAICLLVPVASFERRVLDLFPHADKVAHGLVFAISTRLVLNIVPSHAKEMIVSIILIGGGIEVMQGLSGYRDATWGDWAADIVGVLAGWLILSRPLIEFLRRGLDRQAKPGDDMRIVQSQPRSRKDGGV